MVPNLRDGGIPVGYLTEIFGNPGSGKSNLCLQLAIAAQMSHSMKAGETGGAIYIDTEGSFIPIRLYDIAVAAHSHYKMSRDTSAQVDHRKLLENVTYFRCLNITNLISCIMQLKALFLSEKKIKLIVVDSLAHPLRTVEGDNSLRTKYTTMVVSILQKLATDYKCAVIVTNHTATKVDSSHGEKYTTPTLGEMWGHLPLIRLKLSWKNNCRDAILIKSPHQPEGSVPFQITAGGIRDVDTVTNGNDCPDVDSN
ncbi:unnamed protein product [Didymodactylos carnosus]|uniref:DNA repair protein RAD51 homolog 3 n=1 Tax=Didymodactylos carnosus TaxID=1234261 RepID=A0A8S2HE71_9BILA|nr:unnamed protein product [Didymodactylos carnosus]CAF3635959.1 unnamed protein product [Didymodactylos carnosus]